MKNQTKQATSESRTSESFCALCEEEDGKNGEPAGYMVTITPANGGGERRVALCVAHVESLKKPGSPYRMVAAPTKTRGVRGATRHVEHNKGRGEKGDIKRTSRGVERYSKSERGRLGD